MTKKTKPLLPLRAYAVQEDTEGTGDIHYARHDIEARKAGANEHGGGDLAGISCKRAPWADQYAPGPCPRLVMIDHGWWFECSGCGRTVRDDPSVEDGERSHLKAIEIAGAVYCTPICRRDSLRRKNTEATRKTQAIQRMRDQLWKRVPGITLTARTDHAHVVRDNGKWIVKQVRVGFTFPGCQHGDGTYGFDKPGEAPQVRIARADLEAFEAWRPKRKEKAEA